MSILSRNVLKSFFESGDKPNQSQFASLIDSMLHSSEDQTRLGLRTYSTTRAYIIGDATLHNGSLYEAIANTSGPFNPSHWQKVLSLGSVSYQGTWNAQTNSPALASGVGTQGDYYVVSTSGSTMLDGINTWLAGDYAIFNGGVWERVINVDQDDQSAAEVIYDNTSSGLIATDVQAAIDELEGRIETTETDIANITTTDVAEGTNLYYTETRFDASFLNKDSDDLIEGSVHLFMTSAERTKLSGIEAGATADQLASEVPYSNATSGLTATDVQAAIDEVEARLDTTENDLNTITTTEVPEGANLYYTEARFDTRFNNKTTDNLAEGTGNFYFTDARFDTRFNAKSTDNLSEGTGNLYYTDARFDARFDTRLGTKTTDNLTEGSSSLYFTNERVDDRIAALLTSTNGMQLTYSDTENTLEINLPAGGSGNTLRHNGTSWITSSLLYNNGAKVGINTAGAGIALLGVLGTGNTSSTKSLSVLNSSSAGLLEVWDDGLVTVGYNYHTGNESRLVLRNTDSQTFNRGIEIYQTKTSNNAAMLITSDGSHAGTNTGLIINVSGGAANHALQLNGNVYHVSGTYGLGTFPSTTEKLFVRTNNCISSGYFWNENTSGGAIAVVGLANGTNSTGSNTGGSFSASGSTVANYALTTGDGDVYFQTAKVGIGQAPDSSSRLVLRGTGNTSGTYSIFAMDSSMNSIFHVRDNGDLFAKKLQTADIDATPAPLWKLGAVKTGVVASVSDSYVEVEIAGTVYKLALAN